jgi:hypothetical protein
MKRSIKPLSVANLVKKIETIDFPEFQREDNIWSRADKQRLIDSILRGFDIASFYFSEDGDGDLHCIDGRQRIGAINSFLGQNEDDLRDNYFPLSISDETGVATSDFEKLQGKTWQQIKDDKSTATKELSKLLIDTVNDYQITVCTFTDPTDDQDFNLQFLRLNLGALVNAGEKLNAMTGNMRDLLFDKKQSNHLGHHPFFESAKIPSRRFAKEQVAAQVALQMFTLSEQGDYSRARYLDLQVFLKDESNIKNDDRRLQSLEKLLNCLAPLFKGSEDVLRNRGVVVSVVLLAQVEGIIADATKRKGRAVNTYRDVLEFQRHLTQAVVEKSAIAARQRILAGQFDAWLKTGKLNAKLHSG